MIYTLGLNMIGFEEVNKDFIINYFAQVNEVEYDSETTGIDAHNNRVLCFQLGDKDNQFVIEGSYLKEFKEFLEAKTLIGQNIKFDLRYLYKAGIFPNSVYDTFLAETVIYCGYDFVRKGLGDIAKRRLGIDLDKSLRASIPTKGLSIDVVVYAAKDVEYLGEIKKSQLIDLEEKGLTKALELENEFVLALAYIEHCGFKLNKDRWKAKCDRDLEEYIKARKALDQYIFDNKMSKYIDNQIDLFSTESRCTINWNSPAQVVGLFKDLKIPVEFEKDGDIKQSVGEKHIAKYEKEFPFVGLYIKYKGYEKLIGTYGTNFFNYINPATGRLHTQFKQIMDTGRLSSGGKNKQTKESYINFQNIPSDKETRACFVAEEGNTLLISDYSGQEQVVLANRCLDANLLAFYDNGLADMHSFVASKMYPELEGMDLDEIKEKHKPKRQAAKTAGFAINYGGNGSTIARNNNVTEQEGDDIYEAYFTAFPGLKKYFKKVQDHALANGYILINKLSGRKCFIAGFEEFNKTKEKFDRDFWNTYKAEKLKGSDLYRRMREQVSKWFRFKGTIERMALNYPIQGTSAEITKISCISFFKWIKENNYINIVLFTNTIHDENVIECPLEIASKTSEALKKAMNDAGSIFCKRVPLTAEPEQSLYWKK